MGNDVPKENMHCTCLPSITIDSVLRIDKNHPQVYLEECKYRVKKDMYRFINTELKSDSDSEKIEARVYNKLMTKLEKSDSD